MFVPRVCVGLECLDASCTVAVGAAIAVKHVVSTVELNKISLSADDNKRYLRDVVLNPNGSVKWKAEVASYAYGHWRIKKEKQFADVMAEIIILVALMQLFALHVPA